MVAVRDQFQLVRSGVFPTPATVSSVCVVSIDSLSCKRKLHKLNVKCLCTVKKIKNYIKCPIFETKKDFTKIPTDLNSMYIHTELLKIW